GGAATPARRRRRRRRGAVLRPIPRARAGAGGDPRAVRPPRAPRLPRDDENALRRPARAVPARGLAPLLSRRDRPLSGAVRRPVHAERVPRPRRPGLPVPGGARRHAAPRPPRADDAGGGAAPVRVRRGVARPCRTPRWRPARTPRPARKHPVDDVPVPRPGARGAGSPLPDPQRVGPGRVRLASDARRRRPRGGNDPGGAEPGRAIPATRLVAPGGGDPPGRPVVPPQPRGTEPAHGSGRAPRSSSNRLILALILQSSGVEVDPWQDRCVMPGHSPAPAALLL